jgi:hypothetical protein
MQNSFGRVTGTPDAARAIGTNGSKPDVDRREAEDNGYLCPL